MFENAFLKAASELDNAISLGSLFHSVIVLAVFLSYLVPSTRFNNLTSALHKPAIPRYGRKY